jgi:hypothetical protein
VGGKKCVMKCAHTFGSRALMAGWAREVRDSSVRAVERGCPPNIVQAFLAAAAVFAALEKARVGLEHRQALFLGSVFRLPYEQYVCIDSEL